METSFIIDRNDYGGHGLVPIFSLLNLRQFYSTADVSMKVSA
jgi:hypothetical protein